MTTANDLVKNWRELGPVAWAEGPYGWTDQAGQPITLTPWQRAALQAWWDNRADCTTFAISNVKKTGKTFLDALLLAWRWLALPGLHFALGNDFDQSKSRQFEMITEMVRGNPYLVQVVKIGKAELIFEPTGSKLQALASDSAGNAGANFLTASSTEAWGIVYEQAIRAFEELTPPPGRFYGLPALRICDSYAGYEGESITWHGIVDRGLQGERISEEWPIWKAGGLVLFHATGQEARDTCFRGSPAEAAAYYAEQKASLRTNAFLRMHENQRTAGDGAYVTPEQWQDCYDPELRPIKAGEKLKMVLGIDASTSRDFTSLVGTVWNENTGQVELKLVKVWKPVKIAGLRFGKPTVDIAETIDKEVYRLQAAGQIDCIWLDPYQMHSSLIAYTKAGLIVHELAQNAGRVESDQALFDAINSKAFCHYDDPELNQAVQSASGNETPRGVRIAKIQAGRHIDPLVALSMSHYGSLQHKSQPSTEITFVADPFAVWPPAEGDRYSAIFGWGSEWHEHHSPGATSWKDCRYRQKGCEECYQEQINLPEVKAERELAARAARGEIIMDFHGQYSGPGEPMSDPRAADRARIRQLFNQEARKMQKRS